MLNATDIKNEGNLLAKQGDYKAALEKYELAVQLDSAFSNAWFNKGLMHKKLEQYNQAIISFEKALNLDPSYEKARDNLEQILEHYKKIWLHYQNKINNTPNDIQSMLSQFNCEQYIAAKVIFANVDLKLTVDGKVQILEFGRGMQSGFEGLKIITGKNITSLLEEKYKELHLPKIELNGEPGLNHSDDVIRNKHYTESSKTDNQIDITRVDSYSSIYGGLSIKVTNRHILPMDDSVTNFIFEDKLLTHNAFIQSENQALRPKTLVLERKPTQNLSDKILSEFPKTKYFVLKTPDQEGGKGVVVIKREDIKSALKELLLEFQLPDNFDDILKFNNIFSNHTNRAVIGEEVSHSWNNSDSRYFLVEEYVENKPVEYKKELYDATMRVAFLIIRDAGKVRCEPFACYWKLPPKASSHEDDLRARTVSSYSNTRHDSAAVDAQDKRLVYDQLRESLPKVITAMLRSNIFEHISSQESNHADQRKYKAYLWMHFANSLGHQGNYSLAEHCLNKAKELTPNNYKVYHEFGVLYHLQGKFNEAINYYNEALNKDRMQPSTYIRRARTYKALGRQIEAENDVNQAMALTRQSPIIGQMNSSNYSMGMT